MITEDSDSKKFVTINHNPSPFNIKEASIFNSSAMVLWDTSPPSFQYASSLNKVGLPCPNNLSLDLLACCVVSSMSLDSVTSPQPTTQPVNVSEKEEIERQKEKREKERE